MQQHIRVKLPVIFGIKPSSYLVALIVILPLILFFCLFVLPGILHYGAVVTIESNSPDAFITVAGKTHRLPIEMWFDAGEYDVRLSAPGYVNSREIVVVEGRRFASLLFPAHQNEQMLMSPDGEYNFEAYARQQVIEAFAWSYVQNPDFPQIFSRLSRNYINRAVSAPLEYFDPAFWGSESMMTDSLRAQLQLQSGSSIATAVSISTLADLALDYLNTEDSGIFQSSEITDMQSYRNSVTNRMKAGNNPAVVLADTNVRLGDLVSLGEFLAFSENHELWDHKNYRQLMFDGITQGGYLLHDSNGDFISSDMSAPVLGVSPAAAIAYAQWVQERYPDYRVRLPYPEELEGTARGLESGLWEICMSWATKYPAVGTELMQMQRITDSEALVLSFPIINKSDRISAETSLLLSSPVRLVSASGEYAMIPSLLASEVSTFRLVFEPR